MDKHQLVIRLWQLVNDPRHIPCWIHDKDPDLAGTGCADVAPCRDNSRNVQIMVSGVAPAVPGHKRVQGRLGSLSQAVLWMFNVIGDLTHEPVICTTGGVSSYCYKRDFAVDMSPKLPAYE
jgi:hypothetical protein